MGGGVGPGVPSEVQGGFVIYSFIIKDLSCLHVRNFGSVDRTQRLPAQVCLGTKITEKPRLPP